MGGTFHGARDVKSADLPNGPLTRGLSLCIFTYVPNDATLTPEKVKEMAGCVCFRMRRTTRLVTQLYDKVLRPHHLRSTQLSILVAGSHREEVPLATLAERLGMERTTLLRNVRPLARRKLLKVVPEEGSRRTLLRVTPAGRALLARAYPAWRRTQERVLSAIAGPAWSRSLEGLEAASRRADS